jgi:aspartate/methionine/tyrosine aminotransferase
VEQYPLVYHDGWFIDFDALQERITEHTRAIVVVNPNNPTGSYLKIAELQQLAAVCGERGVAIISDEVFADYALGDDARRVPTLQAVQGILTFCLGGLSKSVGLPQMKLGWIIAGGPAAVRVQALEGLELIADTYLSVGTPIQYALPKLLGMRERIQEQILRRLRANLEFLRVAARHSACTLLNVEGGWYATLRVPRVKSEEQWVLDLLETRDVLVQPGYFYDFDSEAFLVLSLLTPVAIFEEGVGRLLALIQSGD